jgi:tetratricopeptide (TPR) repeat protein
MGACLRCVGRYAEAADFYEDGLATLEAAGGIVLTDDPVTVHLEFGLGVSLATLTRYDEALSHLLIARELAHQSADRFVRAGIDLTMANVHQSRGDAHAALPLVLAARDAYAAWTTPSERRMYGRLHAIAAGMLLDVADVYARRGRSVQDSTYVELAGSFAQQALNEAGETDEEGALYLGLIARARHERFSGRRTSAVDLLGPLLIDAARMESPVMTAQVHTAIAQDFDAQGDREHAFDHYRLALHGARESSDLYLGAAAQRALIRGSQSQP